MKVAGLDELLVLMERRADAWYGMEPVTQMQHALQCAQQAYLNGESAQLIAAALLHDVGHLFEAEDLETLPCADLLHEEQAAGGLRGLFGPAVTEPIRLHVAAKRYLCQARPTYWNTLSQASKASLLVQGNVFSKEEAVAFISRPYAGDAVKLRLWDDRAKNPHAATPDLAFFAPIVERALLMPSVARLMQA